jgi:sugar phosphate isomerase/epimerase
MHERISVHSICFPNAGVEVLLQNWRTLGAQRVSFSSPQVLDYGPQKLRAELDAVGQKTETVTHIFRAGALAPNMQAERDQLARAIDAAAILGANSIYMLTGGRGTASWEEAASMFAEALVPCRALAQDAGIQLAIENTNAFHAHAHLSNNLRDTITLAELASIGVCIDMFACWTEAGLHDLIRRALPRCVLVQVSDYVLGDRSLPCRAVPGDGTIPWPQLLQLFHDSGYTGPFDLELLGPRIDQEGHLNAVRRAADHIANYLRRLASDPH